MKTLAIVCLTSVTSAFAAMGEIILLHGTSSAGKSSLAEVLAAELKPKYEVLAADEYQRVYQKAHPVGTNTNLVQWESDFYLALHRQARNLSDAGKNVIIETVTFDRDYDRYCEILDCPRVVKALVYCPLQDIPRRVERRNKSDDPRARRPIFLAFEQFLTIYKPQSAPEELVVEKTSTTVIRKALVEAGRLANDPKAYEALYREYVAAFGIDRDQDVTVVAKRKYDLVLNTRANTKKKNTRLVEDYIKTRAAGWKAK